MTFSHGAHHCLGAAAARMQSRVALTELLARCPEFEVDESGIVWAGGSYVRRPLSVPFTVSGVMAGDWLGDRRTEVAADRILDAADELFAQTGRRDRRHARNRQGRRMFPRHAVPVLREPGGAVHRVRAPRELPALPRDDRAASPASTNRASGSSRAWSPRCAMSAKVPRCHRGSPPRSDRSARRWPNSREVIKALTEAFLISMAPDDPRVVDARRAGWCG